MCLVLYSPNKIKSYVNKFSFIEAEELNLIANMLNNKNLNNIYCAIWNWWKRVRNIFPLCRTHG